ncbi:MAG: glycosyltransferase family 4 protein [Candidatus Dormibacteria bacterium]
MPESAPLRVALLTYRGNPHSGGQGVYVKHLSRALGKLGHSVEVFSGQPYPEVDGALTRVPSLDLYRTPDPFRTPHPREFRDWVDALEYGVMCTAGFPEPLTYSLRVRRLLQGRRGDFDVIHDNQCLGYGILQLARAGWPVVATIHHPIHMDRRLELLHTTNWKRRISQRRWFGFLRMQSKVARQLPKILTVSENSARDLVQHMGLSPERLAVVPIGVDHELFRPLPEVERVKGRVLAMASADVALKGMMPLLESMARLCSSRAAELVVVAKQRSDSEIPATLRRLGLEGSVRFVSGISDEELVHLYAEAEVAVVPSLYEGFSLPAIQAMACGLPLVATTAGALPEVVGRHEETGLLVEPADPVALAAALDRALGDPELRSRLAHAGRSRALRRFSWEACAAATAEHYREAIGTQRAAQAA